MSGHIQITEKEFDLLYEAVGERISLACSAECNDYIKDAVNSKNAINRIIKRNNLNQGLTLSFKKPPDLEQQ